MRYFKENGARDYVIYVTNEAMTHGNWLNSIKMDKDIRYVRVRDPEVLARRFTEVTDDEEFITEMFLEGL
jgi:hypothetical protein